jgi:bifunctional DNase/RNase
MARCDEENCEKDACVHFTVVEDRGSASYRGLCDAHSRSFLPRCLGLSVSAETAGDRANARLQLVTYDERSLTSALYLTATTWQTPLKIESGTQEAWFLDNILRGQTNPRPLTHQAFVSTITALDSKLTGVLIDDFDVDSKLFYAKLVLLKEQTGQEILVDLRPSDAIALAIVAGAPITVSKRAHKNLDLLGGAAGSSSP